MSKLRLREVSLLSLDHPAGKLQSRDMNPDGPQIISPAREPTSLEREHAHWDEQQIAIMSRPLQQMKGWRAALASLLSAVTKHRGPTPTCACVLSCFSRVRLCATPWTAAHQAPLSMGFSRQEYWSGLPCPPLGDLPDPGIKPTSLVSPALAGGFFTTSATWEAP